MPIYAYKCESCGFAKDVLQKMSDAPLDTCPNCSQPTFKKQLTAAGFQLKGSGWYATDFKGAGAAPSTAVAPSEGGAIATGTASEPAAPKADAAPAAGPAPAASGS
ncbi:MAG: zinc ribbon domain-containing protein [Rhodoferax sp.]|nr:zinc ribbon domain-containing protein [Rhodoferax sp.]